MRQPEEQVIDFVARRVRSVRAAPGHRDLLAVAGIACIVAAIALWQPLVGLAALGAVLIAVAFLTAPEGANDGS